MKQTFNKNERLKSDKRIEFLFKSGNAIKAFPFKALYYAEETPRDWPLRLAVSVPKRSFKKAVDRNRIKRLMREAWRVNNVQLKESLSASSKSMDVFLLYTGKKLPEFDEVESKINEILKRLSEGL